MFGPMKVSAMSSSRSSLISRTQNGSPATSSVPRSSPRRSGCWPASQATWSLASAIRAGSTTSRKITYPSWSNFSSAASRSTVEVLMIGCPPGGRNVVSTLGASDGARTAVTGRDAGSGRSAVARRSTTCQGDVMTDRLALVIGGSSEIGTAIGVELGALGFVPVLWGRDPDRLAVAAQVCAAAGAPARTEVVDVTDHTDLTAAVARLTAHGPLEVVVYAAGQFDWAMADVADPSAWDRLFAVNLVGAAVTTRLVLPHLLAAAPSALVYRLRGSPHRVRQQRRVRGQQARAGRAGSGNVPGCPGPGCEGQSRLTRSGGRGRRVVLAGRSGEARRAADGGGRRCCGPVRGHLPRQRLPYRDPAAATTPTVTPHGQTPDQA